MTNIDHVRRKCQQIVDVFIQFLWACKTTKFDFKFKLIDQGKTEIISYFVLILFISHLF